MTQPPNDIYEFGECRLEGAERLFYRAGKHVPLTPKVFDTLLLLVRSGGRLVRKDELLRSLWPDTVVEEANLARNIWTLRRALADGEGDRSYIETIPKIGYRFVAPVRLVTSVTDVAPAGAPVHDAGGARPVPERAVPEAPPPARRSRPMMAAGLAIAGLAAAGLAAYWSRPPRAQAREQVEPAFSVLTDGRQDDVGASWTHDGRIQFSRFSGDGRGETWLMEADGSNPRRRNAAIKSLLIGRWSPDGRQVLFSKEDDPGVVYLADANGGNEIRLPFQPGNFDWSPDGSRFVYQSRPAGANSIISLYTIETGVTAVLSRHPAGDADPSFSPDGTRIAFTSWRDGNAEIYVMQADGSNVRRMTNHPAFDNFPVFSPDGTQLAFQSNREEEQVEIYLLNVDGERAPVRLTRSETRSGLVPGCWSRDGTRMLVYTNQTGHDQIAVIPVDPYPVRPLIADANADLGIPRVAANGRQLLYEARLADRSVELRLTDLQTQRTRRLYRTEPGYSVDRLLAPAWAPDDSLIAFSPKVDGNSDVFTMRPDGTDLRNLTRNPLLESTPAFTADGRAIVFSRDEFGRAQLYLMDRNGGNERRVTRADGYEMHPAVSPDGRSLAFAGDRASRGLDILLLDLANPARETVLVARRQHDVLPAFSPDGRHVAFVANSDGNAEIYLTAADGTGLVRLTRNGAEDTAPQFTSDGQRLVFSSRRGGRAAIYELRLR